MVMFDILYLTITFLAVTLLVVVLHLHTKYGDYLF